MIRFLCLLFALALATTSCFAPRLRVTDIPIAKRATFDLMSPASLGQSISLEQIVDAKYGDKEFSFHCLLEVDPMELVLVGMTPMNTRAFTLTLNDESFTIDMAPGAKLPADPSRILADLQLALWPDPKVKGLIRLSSWKGAANSAASEFHDNGRIFARFADLMGEGSSTTGTNFPDRAGHVIEIRYEANLDTGEAPWAGIIEFRNIEQDYSLKVKTIRAEQLAP